MTKSVIYTFKHENGEIVNVQSVCFDSFSELNFFRPQYSGKSLEQIYRLYHDFIARKYAWILGNVVMFHLPEELEIPFENQSDEYDTIYDPLALVALNFRRHIQMKRGKLVFDDRKTEEFYFQLERCGALKTVRGSRNYLAFLPVSHKLGYLTSGFEAEIKVNSSFFVMDLLDCATVFDHVGNPIGLSIKDGKVLSVPLFDREVLYVDKSGNVYIRRMSLNDITVIIDDKEYCHDGRALFYSLPQFSRTPEGGYDVIIVDNEVVAVKSGGNSEVPASGFVMKLPQEISIRNRKVSYGDMDDVAFAIQVGNSAVVNGVKTERFISKFGNYLNPFSNSYPPSMYPLNYRKDRAPRIVLGADNDNKPVILWFEGAGKFGYQAGLDSCGASLSEVAEICQRLGLRNAVNLDGGGSAQILVDNQRSLKLSDRDPDDFSEQERAIAVGLYLK